MWFHLQTLFFLGPLVFSHCAEAMFYRRAQDCSVDEVWCQTQAKSQTVTSSSASLSWANKTVSIGNDQISAYSAQPTSCETRTASLCATASSTGLTISAGVTLTTTSWTSTCASVLGCNVRDSATTAITTGPCATETVTDVWVSCPYLESTTTSRVCQTARTSVISGCAVTATTITCARGGSTAAVTGAKVRRTDGPSACNTDTDTSTETYVIYPKNGMDKIATQAIIAILAAPEFNINQDLIYTSDTISIGINFWLIPLTFTQSMGITMILKLNPYVASVYRQKGENVQQFDPSTTINSQFNADAHLTFMSQQGSIPLANYGKSYYFDGFISPGQNIPVYILDSGASLGHTEFDWIRAQTRWITVGNDVDPNDDKKRIPPAKDDSQVDPENIYQGSKAHGTAMLSLISGRKMGVSKLVTPIIIRMPRRTLVSTKDSGKIGGATPEDYIEGLSKVCDDLAAQGITTSSTTTSILLMSLFFPRPLFERAKIDESDGFSGRMQILLRKAVSQGVLPITGSGNVPKATIDGWPASLGGTVNGRAAVPELLVVGGVLVSEPFDHLNGDKSPTSTDEAKGLPHIYAPGSGVRAASGHNPAGNQYKDTAGTSTAAALTAGLAAYFLALARSGALTLDDTPAGLKAYIIQTSYPRKDGYPAVWNGAVPDANTCPWKSPGTAATKRNLPIIGQLRGRQNSAVNSDSGWEGPITCGIPTSLKSILATESHTQSGGTRVTAIGTTSGIANNTSTSAIQPSSTISTWTSATPSSRIISDVSDVASSTQSSSFITVTCNSATPVPGQCGNAACAYVIASAVPDALCTTDYCNCGGKLGPLLTTTVSGSVSSGCHYTTVPTCMNCASAECTSTTTTSTTTISTTAISTTAISTTDISPMATSTPATKTATPTSTVSPLTLGTQQCNDKDSFIGHSEISIATVNMYANLACTATGQKDITGSSDPFKPVRGLTAEVNYYMAITWVAGCTTTVTSQNPRSPIPGNPAVTCLSLLSNNFKNCANTGVGGSIVVGCVKYVYMPSKDGVIP